MKKIIASLALTLTSLPLFAEEAAPANGGQNMVQTFVMIGVALVFFYFILWRPEQKRRKAMEQQRGAMKKGDRVTAMGIIGTVSKIQEKTVVLRMIDGAKIEVVKSAITDVQPGSEEDTKRAEKEDSKRVELNPSDTNN